MPNDTFKPNDPTAKPGLLNDAVRLLVENFKVMGLYIGSFSVLLTSLFGLAKRINQALNLNMSWPGYAIASTPLLLTIIFHSIPEFLKRSSRKRRKLGGLTGEIENPNYFRIRPYKDVESDRSDYSRADDLHNTILTWIRTFA